MSTCIRVRQKYSACQAFRVKLNGRFTDRERNRASIQAGVQSDRETGINAEKNKGRLTCKQKERKYMPQ